MRGRTPLYKYTLSLVPHFSDKKLHHYVQTITSTLSVINSKINVYKLFVNAHFLILYCVHCMDLDLKSVEMDCLESTTSLQTFHCHETLIRHNKLRGQYKAPLTEYLKALPDCKQISLCQDFTSNSTQNRLSSQRIS